MKDQRKTEIRVGITVIVALLIVLWVFSWAKNITVNSNRKEIKIEFSSVAGLEKGDPVTINGVRKGYVKDIFINNNSVSVVVNLDPDVNIKDDAKFYVMMLDLMGGKKIEINPGNSTNQLNFSNLQQGQFLGDISTAMALFGSVETDLVAVIKEVKITLSHLNNTLSDQQFNKDFRASLSNLSQLTENLNELILANSTELNDLLKNSVSLTKSVNEFVSTNKDSTRLALSTLRLALEDSKSLISRVNNFIDQTNNNQNNLGRIINDPAIVNDLKSSLNQLKELTKLLLEQLKKEGIKVDANINLF
jgi:phospholipid/cholesterol/gamma-HCH transport system substrate-binding protein